MFQLGHQPAKAIPIRIGGVFVVFATNLVDIAVRVVFGRNNFLGQVVQELGQFAVGGHAGIEERLENGFNYSGIS